MLVGLAVLAVLAWAMSALFGRIGDRLRRPHVVQIAGMMLMMSLMFVSSAFASLDRMPGWIQAIATVNAVGHATDVLRAPHSASQQPATSSLLLGRRS